MVKNLRWFDHDVVFNFLVYCMFWHALIGLIAGTETVCEISKQTDKLIHKSHKLVHFVENSEDLALGAIGTLNSIH